MALFRRSRMVDPLAGVNLLDLKPVRRAAWTEDDDHRVTLERPKPTAAGLRGLGERFGHLSAPPRVRLDAIGSLTWLQLDGATTVGTVAERVRGAFGEAAEPVEERVGHFVRLLKREGLLDY